ncbi:glycoside hydrolase family 2 protein [Pedobacter arcticus]|uniref:glycoside hydrolase family 2 protein n=1 Tax=Pedobacter arcticus TaxID=752140 RepID=UPI00031712E6|nr:glycoside hydrolase family 2 TIM barrel-domain containing protein [Pedobacter arcticus]
MKFIYTVFFVLLLCFSALAQNQYELNDGWLCAPITQVKDQGENISSLKYTLSNWKKAVVPGTVLTTMLQNKEVPDPFYGMNNQKIADIYDTGSATYTYWFVKDFEENASNEEQVWLHLRGVNYSCDVFVNGQKLNSKTHEGMFLRQTYNITKVLNKNGKNRLAVIVYPPNPVGKPNGGQAGDGTIAKNVSHQYVAGWDWIQPIRDRNTGIWDKVTIEKTGMVKLSNPHVVTLVPGKRKPSGNQAPAIIKVSAELNNTATKVVKGVVQYSIAGQTISKKVKLAPLATTTISLDDFELENPQLWWPSGYGDAFLYPMEIKFVANGKPASSIQKLQVGVREIQHTWNSETKSQQVSVNGQKIFIKGGNWIISDAMLRFTDARYDTEVRFHKEMNLNLIRVWGGALIERPEFYNACDKYGMLVFQDFWMSGDANGRWLDPKKTDDQYARRKYPDDHQLFLTSAADQIKMVRNHASLAIWCGGNEIMPPDDILIPLRDSIIPKLDGTRWFIDFSNSNEMSLNEIGGNGDGPYEIQPIERFWNYRTWPFNSEIGSVGVGDYESLKRFIPKENMIAPQFDPATQTEKIDSVWDYHKYISYGEFVNAYGAPRDVQDFTEKAQLVNYNQYRALIEGFSANMWRWYTGVIIWKTQNPWTALRGQMYDYYLDQNACFYGLKNGSASLHAMYNPVDGMINLVNNSFEQVRNRMLLVKIFDMDGKEHLISKLMVEIDASSSKKSFAIKKETDRVSKNKGAFLVLQLEDMNKNVVDQNVYWLPDANQEYSGLQTLANVKLQAKANRDAEGKIVLNLENAVGNNLSFFNRISLVNAQTKERVLPVFYTENYLTVLPGEQKQIKMEYSAQGDTKLAIEIKGWNGTAYYINIQP